MMGNREVCRHHSNGGFYDTEADCYICDMEQQLAVLSLENIRIVLEAKQCHEQNDRLVTEHYELRRELVEMELRIHEACEVYAGMEGFIPVHAETGYVLQTIEQMYKELLGVQDEQ